ncbi:MAG: metallophosphoesterase family protein [Armatimonadota bacterium]
MRIAHIADVHLGYRAYSRVTSRGLNQREADVFRAFRSVLDRVAELDPDLIIIAGDLFHTVRPSNFAIHQTFRLLSDLRGRTAAPMVIIGGNHDTPKSRDTGCILDLYTVIEGMYVRHHGFEGIALPGLDAAVYCLPYFALEERRQHVIRPDSGRSVNVLAVHGTVEGVIRQSYDSDQVAPGELNLEAWDYVALGHYHIHTQLADNAFYSGAIEYTSSNIWEEAHEHPKGFIVFDTETCTASFHETPTVRRVVDLPPVRAGSLGAAELMEKVEERLAPFADDLPELIIRLPVEAFPRELQRDLDWKRLRELKLTALHLDIVFRPARREDRPGESTERGEARPIEVEWREFAGSLEDLPAGVDRDRLVGFGLHYLEQAAEEQQEAPV